MRYTQHEIAMAGANANAALGEYRATAKGTRESQAAAEKLIRLSNIRDEMFKQDEAERQAAMKAGR